MGFGLVSKKDKAMKDGYIKYEKLKEKLIEKINEEKNVHGSNLNICKTPKEWLDILYSSNEFKEFVKSSLVVKDCCKKISNIKIFVAVILLLIVLGVIFFMRVNVVSIILIAICAISLILFSILFRTGKSYKDYYNETMSNILLMSIGEYIKRDKVTTYNKSTLKEYLDIVFDNYSAKYDYELKNNNFDIEDLSLELTEVVENSDNNSKETTIVFSGFFIILKNKMPYNVLNGSVIKIREDKSLMSYLLEDTVNSMVQRKREYSFNSERLNKNFDCNLTHTISNVDEKMFEVTKIITPAFEERLLFLEERYNVFNMNISDDEISFVVNLKKDAYKMFSDGNMLKLLSKYKFRKFDTNINASSLYSNDDFKYSNLYPILERLFLYKYLEIIYNYYIDGSRVSNYELEKISQYENEIREIMEMEYKEFLKIQEDYIKLL